MDQNIALIGYLTIWIILYQFVIIPRTATAAFNTWRERLEDERGLIVDITEPVIDEIELIIDNKFSSFFGSVSQLGKRAEEANPANKMTKAIKSGDLYNILAEYVASKAGLGGLTDLIQPKTGQKQGKDGVGLGKL